MKYDPRKEKRAMRKMGMDDHVHEAYNAGECLAANGKPYRNSYPAGRRHDEFKRGYEGTELGAAWHHEANLYI